MTPTNGERLAVLETKLDQVEDRVERIDAKVDALDGKLDLVLLELAKRPSASGWTLSKAGQQAIGGIIGAVLLYLAAAVGVPLPVPRAESTPAEQTPHTGP
jgi:hypothetical protein